MGLRFVLGESRLPLPNHPRRAGGRETITVFWTPTQVGRGLSPVCTQNGAPKNGRGSAGAGEGQRMTVVAISVQSVHRMGPRRMGEAHPVLEKARERQLLPSCAGGGFFLACEDFLGKVTHSPPALFFFYKLEISSHTLTPLFRPGSVHSGSAS